MIINQYNLLLFSFPYWLFPIGIYMCTYTVYTYKYIHIQGQFEGCPSSVQPSGYTDAKSRQACQSAELSFCRRKKTLFLSVGSGHRPPKLKCSLPAVG